MTKTILSFLIAVVFFSCTKQNDDDEYTPIESEISKSLEPYLFEVGSYWIYKEQTTEKFDTLTLISVSRERYAWDASSPGQGPDAYDNYYDLTYNSNINGASTVSLFNEFITKDFIDGSILFMTKNVDESYFPNAKRLGDTLILNINNITYNKVIKMQIEKDQGIDDDMNLYYKDSIGIIRKEIRLNSAITETWDLVKDSVVLKEKF